MKKNIWILMIIAVLLSCAKLPISATPSNDSILSGGSDTPKPNPADPVNPDNPTEEPNYAENSNTFLGMPYIATTDAENSFNNYLINRTYLTTSFNNAKAIPNWVAWHLEKAHIGTQDRGDFKPDPLLPFSWIWIDKNSYTNSLFDRGHNCPSGDRTLNDVANLETFYMTNIIPQSPRLNQQPWQTMESYIRDYIKNNNYEAYIYMGSFGIGGTNSALQSIRKIVNKTGRTFNDGSRDSIWVPKYIFKIVIFIPEGTNDMDRILANNGNEVKVLAVLCPNQQNDPATDALWTTGSWQSYITDIKTIEETIAFYKDIEESSTYPATNPLNPPISFLSKIKNATIKTNLKTKRWIP